MRFRFIDSNGKEGTANGLASLLNLTKEGILTEDTLVFDETEGRWRRARDINYLSPTADSQPNGAPRPERDRYSVASAEPSVPDPSATNLEGARPESEPHTVDASAEPSVPDFSSANLEGPPPLNLALASGQESTWHRLTAWLHDDATCGKVAFGFLGLCALMLCMLVAASPAPDAAEKFGEALGRVLVVGAVIFFLFKRWGKGRAFLMVSVLLFCLLGYAVQSLVTDGATSARKTKLMMSVFTDIQRHAQAFSNEILGLRIDTLFEMLDGKRAYQKSDLTQMQNNVAVAEKRTKEVLSYFENRTSQARRELADIDPAAAADFTNGINKTFPKMKELYLQEAQYFREIDALLAFIREQSGPFEVTATSGIRFRNAGDSAEYDRRIASINKLAASINAMKVKSQGDAGK